MWDVRAEAEGGSRSTQSSLSGGPGAGSDGERGAQCVGSLEVRQEGTDVIGLEFKWLL